MALFLVLSLLALREFSALVPRGERDRRALAWIVAVVAPLHFWFVLQHWYGMFAIFIPVYAFLFLPVLLALSGLRASAADPDALWKIVNSECVRNQVANGAPAPCSVG